jgi:hypothetical protein
MKISGVDIRPGNILEYEGGIWKVAKIQHTQPGKGGAYMQVEMKNLQDGRKTNVRFRSADTIERVAWIPRIFSIFTLTAICWCSWTRIPTTRSTLPADLIRRCCGRVFSKTGMVSVCSKCGRTVRSACQLPEQGSRATDRRGSRGG